MLLAEIWLDMYSKLSQHNEPILTVSACIYMQMFQSDDNPLQMPLRKAFSLNQAPALCSFTLPHPIFKALCNDIFLVT